MAMEDASILIHVNMSFNPFRSQSSYAHSMAAAAASHSSPSKSMPPQQQRRTYDPDDDSWHTNAPAHNNNNDAGSTQSRQHPNGGGGRPPTHSPKRSSSALAWFSGWATSSTTAITPSSTRHTSSVAPPATAAAGSAPAARSSAIIIEDDQHSNPNYPNTKSAPLVPSLSTTKSSSASHRSPARSITMNRGMASPEGRELHQAIHTDFNQDAIVNSIPKPPLHENIMATAPRSHGWATNNVQQNGSRLNPIRRNSDVETSTTNVDTSTETDHGIQKFDLPPYPVPRKASETQSRRRSSSVSSEPLLEDFPKPQVKASTTPSTSSGKVFPRTTPNAAHPQHRTPPIKRHKQIAHDKDESTFPGFALFQTAKAHHSLGRLDRALDTTTECLAFQKSSLNGLEGSSMAKGNASIRLDKNPAAAAAAAAANSPGKAILVDNNIIDAGAAAAMMPLDLRTTFVTGVGSSVQGLVQSLKQGQLQQQQQQQNAHHHHPMLSNSIAIMISQYPLHPCIAQTLLLRAHLLSERYCKAGEDFSILLQAVQHVEMAIAIERKLVIVDEELSPSLLFLGNLRTKLGHYSEAQMAYEESATILRGVRSCAKMYHNDAVDHEDADVTTDCASNLKRVIRDIATALYLHGKSYHCQRMHRQAFDCYNKALNLFKKGGVGQKSLGVKRIVRCMKNRYALEKLVSAYWDDAGVI